MDNKENTFEFSYSAPTEKERREIESIRRQYEIGKDTYQGKLARIKALDKRVKRIPTIVALCFGIIGTLIFGLGLSLVLALDMIPLGIVCSAVGILPILVAYPIYNLIHEKQKQKYGEEILRLTDEILTEKEK